MLQMARLAPRVLGPAADRVARFLQGQLLPGGGARDRAGRPDLWYTAFALDALLAMDVSPDPAVHRAWLDGFGDGAGLDLVHLACLARCWAALGGAPQRLVGALADRVVAEPTASVYLAFLRRGAIEDLGAAGTTDDELVRWLHRHRREDGAFADDEVATAATTPVTAAAVVLLRQQGAPVPPGSLGWLRARLHPEGGFVAGPDAPIPDLLSTAVALHALDAPGRPVPARVRERCLDFVDSLWTGEAFCATWADDEVDAEYAFYGLLALGHLA